MGYYLNAADSFELYEREIRKPYFVDKTEFLMMLAAGEPVQVDKCINA